MFRLLEDDYGASVPKARCLISVSVPAALGSVIGGGLADIGIGSATAGVLGTTLADAGIGAGIGALAGNPLMGAGIGAGFGLLSPSSLNAMGLTGAPGAANGPLGIGANTSPSAAANSGVLTGQAGAPTAIGSSTGLGSLPASTVNPNSLTGQGLGALRNVSGTSQSLGALAALGQFLSNNRKPNYSNMPGPQNTALGPNFNTPLMTSGYVNRTATPFVPATGNWQTYGEQAEPQFFANNQLSGLAHGGALSHAPMFDSSRGGSHVHGPGGGQDDLVNARLSPGEWVADANFVSQLGDGSNEHGSKVLYAMRDAVMRDKGVKHTVPPKLKKSPLQYLAEAKKKVRAR